MKGFIKEIVIAVIIAFVIMQFIKPTIVKESSMQPTLYENNYILLNKQAYHFGEPKRGDIIVFHTGLKLENGKEKMLIKRVIGLPGETITIKEGNVYINDKMLDQSFTKDGYTDGDIENLKIPEGELFVMGDNRLVSIDSRLAEVGCVKIDDVLGKAFVRLYPFNEIRTF
ncbi:signal peptidase I [Aminipila luticellarii]|uniref:Signal peptidase I n=1 Tax=Aminipila luticellarii TaxID=2507160 RepID=A0A410PX09_9FIRM|nr:signal peptidase I [Aminipila luticellarii]QAT43483.1 signal peptidase I [Aminipila luticellarii]